MDDEHEQLAMDDVRERLCQLFPELDPAVVEAAVRLSYAELTESPIRDFVPILVEHAARDRLAFAKRDRTGKDRPSSPSTQGVDEKYERAQDSTR